MQCQYRSGAIWTGSALTSDRCRMECQCQAQYCCYSDLSASSTFTWTEGLKAHWQFQSMCLHVYMPLPAPSQDTMRQACAVTLTFTAHLKRCSDMRHACLVCILPDAYLDLSLTCQTSAQQMIMYSAMRSEIMYSAMRSET